MNYKISVIIPTYNRPEGLRAAINSVLSQSMRPDEIIVINDGDALESLDDLLDKGVIYYRNPKPMGGNFSRHKGVELSSGDILMFLDDDDTWTMNKVRKQVELFHADADVGLVYCNRNVVDEAGNLVRKITSSKQGNLHSDIFLSNIIGTTSSVAIKSDIYQKTGGFDPNMPALQDYDLWIRAVKLTKVALVNDYVINYTVANVTRQQISKSGDKQKQAVELILRKYRDDIARLTFVQRRKMISNFYFYIAKSYKGKSLRMLVLYATRSIFNYPNLKSIVILLPKKVLGRLAY